MLAILEEYKNALLIAVAAIAVSAIFFAGWFVNGWRKDAKIAELEKANSDSVIKFQEAARQKEAEWNNAIKKANDNHAQREQILVDNAAASSAAANSLRSQLAKIRGQLSGSTSNANNNGAIAATDILGDCVTKYQELAAKADRHVNDERTLIEGWPK